MGDEESRRERSKAQKGTADEVCGRDVKMER